MEIGWKRLAKLFYIFSIKTIPRIEWEFFGVKNGFSCNRSTICHYGENQNNLKKVKEVLLNTVRIFFTTFRNRRNIDRDFTRISL